MYSYDGSSEVVEMIKVDPIAINNPLLILIPLDYEIKINFSENQRIFRFAESCSEVNLENAQLMADEDVVTGFVEANLRTLWPFPFYNLFGPSLPQQWICAVVDRDDDDTVVVEEASDAKLVYCKRFQLLAIADENSLPELIESYIQQGLISVKNAYPMMRRFNTSLSYFTIKGGLESQLSAGDYSEVIVGDFGTATARDCGTATAGDRGIATAGEYGTAIVGAYGKAQVLSGSVETGEFSLGVVVGTGVLSLGRECLGFIHIDPAQPSENSRFRAGLGSRIRVELPDHSIIPVVIDGEEYLPDVFYTVNQQREIVEWEKL